MNYSENDKKLFYEVFSSKGKNSWTIAYKKQYVYFVQQSVDISNKKLAENIVNEDTSKIFEEIIKYDSDLKLFKQFLKSHEIYARKSIEIHKFEMTHDEKALVNSLDNIPYDYKIPDGWTPIEFFKSGEEVIITLAKGAFHAANVTFDENKFDADMWKQLTNNVLNLTDNKYSTLRSIKTELMEEARVISKVKFDLQANTLELGMDYSYIQNDGKKASKIQHEEDKEIITKEIGKILCLSDERIELIQNNFETQENSIFTKNVFNKLLDLKKDDLIIVPTKHHFYREDTTVDEYSEKAIISQDKQKLSDIEKKVKEYYSKNGTLIGFFEEYQEHNTSKPEITERLKKNAETTKFHAYAILIRNISEFEKDLNEDKMKGKMIDSITFDFDVNDKKIEITNNNYTKEIYEALISKILEFSE